MNSTMRPIDLSLGDPCYDPPLEATGFAFAALKSQRLGYAPPEGLQSLRELIALRMSASRGINIDPSQVLITSGASMGLYSALVALLEPGDAVMCPNPGYPNYAALVSTLGGTPVYYQLGNDKRFSHSIEELERVLPSSASIIIWNSPANPTGSVATEAVTRRLADLANDRKLWIISDEVYEDIVFEGSHHSPASFSQTNNVVIISSFSKSYALSGWRVGHLVLPQNVYQLGKAAHWTSAMSPCTLSQYAAIGALQTADSYLVSLGDKLKSIRDRAVRMLAEHEIAVRPPQGAFYLWIDIRATNYSAQRFCEVCWKQAWVQLSPGTIFGTSGQGFVRLSFAGLEDEVLDGVERVAKVYKTMIQDRVVA